MNAESTSSVERLHFMQIDEQTRSSLREFSPFLEKEIDGILDSFYSYIASHNNLENLFSNPDHIALIKKAQRSHWIDLFQGKFDDEYFQRVQRIGMAHDKVGLEPRWYIGGYNFALCKMISIIQKYYGKKPDKAAAITQAVIKAALLDMDVAISVYIEKGEENKMTDLMAGISKSLELSLQSAIKNIIGLSGDMANSAQQMVWSINHSLKQVDVANAASQKTKSNVQSVATASEELLSSVREISSQTSRSS